MVTVVHFLLALKQDVSASWVPISFLKPLSLTSKNTVYLRLKFNSGKIVQNEIHPFISLVVLDGSSGYL